VHAVGQNIGGKTDGIGQSPFGVFKPDNAPCHYAESFDESVARFRGLQTGMQLTLTADDTGLLVRPEIARQQIDQETAPAPGAGGGTGPLDPTPPPEQPRPGGGRGSGPVPQPKPRRYHGTVDLDPARVGRDAGRIADEVITHLVGLVGSTVKVTLEIEAEIPEGASDNFVRTVTENSRTLKFAGNSGFETE
jgi:hypothetical protein